MIFFTNNRDYLWHISSKFRKLKVIIKLTLYYAALNHIILENLI